VNGVIPIVCQSESFTEEDIASLAAGIDAGGKLLAHTILVGCDRVTKSISEKSAKYTESIVVDENKQIKVPDVVKQSIATVKEISPTAVAVSSAIVGTLSFLATEISHTLSQEFSDFRHRHRGSNNEPGIFSVLEPYLQSPKLQAAKEISSSTFGAVVNVWDALEEAGMALYDSSGNAAVQILDKKYGSDLADTTKDLLSVTSDIVQTGINIRDIGTRSALKAVAADQISTIKAKVTGEPSARDQFTSKITSIEVLDLDPEEEELRLFSQLETVSDDPTKLVEQKEQTEK